jgi:flagellar biosynthesis protein FlhA
MSPGDVKEKLGGVETVEPAFGLPAEWVHPRDRQRAEMLGYTVVDAPAVLATHLMEVLKSHAHEILSRQAVRNLIDGVKEDHPALVDDLVPGAMSLGDVHKVLRNLLRERVPVRDLPLILEALSDHASETKDIEALTEMVRRALAKSLTREFRGPDDRVRAILVDPTVEERLHDAFRGARTEGMTGALAPAFLARLAESAATEAERVLQAGGKPLMITAPTLRPQLKRIVESRAPDLPVLSFMEIAPEVTIESEGMVTVHDED